MALEHKVMLAPSKTVDIINVDYPQYIQPKFDGFRVTYIPGEGFLSRTGKTFRNGELNDYFNSVFNVSDTVLDGEFYIHGIPFQDLTSVISKEGAKIPKELKFYVFDAIPLDEWNNRKSTTQYNKRLTLLRKTLNRIADYSKVIDVATDVVNSSGEALTAYKTYLTNGYEGAIFRSMDGLYVWRRTAKGEIGKLKPSDTVDLEVVDMFEGEGKYEGMLGGLVCAYGEGTVNLGTGFSDEERKMIFKDKKSYLNKIVEVKFLEKTKDDKSLRHPVFVRWRFDKETP